jgi:hypothetical protein
MSERRSASPIVAQLYASRQTGVPESFVYVSKPFPSSGGQSDLDCAIYQSLSATK